ncbi:MAG: hypothetical protein U0230_09210 [Polyangiales bacterium]
MSPHAPLVVPPAPESAVPSPSTDPRIAPIPGIEAELFVEPSREQWFWVRKMGWLFAPTPGEESRFARWYGIATVVPSTNVTNFSLQYQSYLNDIFHTTWVARLGHTFAMPFVVMFMQVLARELGGEPWALAFASILTAWWLGWAFLERDVVFGAALLGTSLGLYFGGRWASAVGIPALPALGIFAAIQMLSHTFEPLPPRVSRSPRWVPVFDYLTTGPWSTRLRRAGQIGVQFGLGTVAEALASPRLLCVIVLEALWLSGHRREQRDAWKTLSRRALESGNPALDYIGIGGGTPLRAP